ncbi:MAG: YggS family pyridoxal phosphate-dependent enzyme [Alphaproteobacteria bacterium]|nr:YggS family pyridoxal phosphate-dependent enzyme [Alphaproteobacteria bacterium]
MTIIAQNLDLIRKNINKAALSSGLAPDHVTLVAVSKTCPAEAVQEALLAGQRVFGENRVQEAASKFPALKGAYPDLELHLIGPLQTNKVAQAIKLFDVIETLDRPKLAEALAQEIKKQGRIPRLFIEVNTGNEPQKAGVSPQNVPNFLAFCQKGLGLPIEGLMCIPPFDQDPTSHFVLLHNLATQLDLPSRSMGMSADYETAIAHGATHVRVGTAIFGHRSAPLAS